MDLTEEQREIVCHGQGHARVSAVAGSGKTTTMIARVGYLLEQGVPADQQLILMFNRSAKDAFFDSMKRRLASLARPFPQVRTFHSLGHRLITSFTKRGALAPFRLVTEDYVQERLAKQVATQTYRQGNGGDGYISQEDVEEFLNFIDLVKSTIDGAESVFKKLQIADRYRYFINGFTLFEKVRKQKKIRFYSDLIYEPLMAMLADESLADWVANRVDHIIVDEYQDINEVQQQLLTILAGERAQVMVVGDVDQCIYEWRGARPEYIIKRFQLDFATPKNYTLSYTFRYGHRLSLAANHLIDNNSLRDRKLCISQQGTIDTHITHLEEKTEHPVVSLLKDWQQKGRKLSEVAVLVRLFALSVPVELALLEAEIPYRLEGNEQVFGCQEIMALMGYIKLSIGVLTEAGRDESIAMILAMLSQPHLGVRRAELELLAGQIVDAPADCAELIAAWGNADTPVFISKRFSKTAKNWRWISSLSSRKTADVLLKKIIDRLELYDFYHSFSSRSATAENRVKTCQAFAAFAARQKLQAQPFLEKIAALMGHSESSAVDSLLITSVHRAKGLEWPLVIVPGLEDGSFPLLQERGVDGEENLEDERRLFYVAMTRAIEKVVLIHPADNQLEAKMKNGSSSAPVNILKASRFLFEMNFSLSDNLGRALHRCDDNCTEQFEAIDNEIAGRYLVAIGSSMQVVGAEKKTEEIEKPRKILAISEIAEGLNVWHHKFGSGVVTEVRDRKQGRLQVLFEDHGEMILLAQYAGLRSC